MNKYIFGRCSYVILMIMIIVSLPACSSNKNSSEANSSVSRSTSIPESREVASVKVFDALGQEIVFENVPLKIATISPTATEMLYAAGGSSILRDRASNYPEIVLSLPNVGSAYNPSVEAILSSNPDLVVIEAVTQARFTEILGALGLKVFAVKAESVEDIENGILNLGKILRTEEIANKKIKSINDRLKELESSDARSVLMLVSDQDRNFYAARPESYTGLIAEILGMENKAAGLSDSGPFPGFALMNPEAILLANPDIIVTISPAPEPAPRLSATITRIPPFANLNAIKMNNILEADVALFLQAPGPRIVDAVEFLKLGLDPK